MSDPREPDEVASGEDLLDEALGLAFGPPLKSDHGLVEGPGTVIGRYQLLQAIGEGGFGVVYMAEQLEPIRRRVALKVIKLGMETKAVIARFEAERQALSLMDHPNIARVLDAGATETGRPFFVMELVRGVPITDYCNDNRMSTRERLTLFVDVCHAVQHAHHKGIIHRDLKPSNVLVTHRDGMPMPKVIDFGVAKATQSRLTEKTLFTQYGQFIGTPAYMSPEQAEMSELDIDTRSDVYSLGVLLYELLTDMTPIDQSRLHCINYARLQQLICEEEPVKPSTRLSGSGEALVTIAAQRRVEPRKLTQLIRGDLDWIVMKALEKDRGRRYATANSLAADVARHLKDEAVEAGPPTMRYRLYKFVSRRRKRLAALSSLLGLAALLILVGSLMLAESRKRLVAATLVEQLLTAETPDVPEIIRQLDAHHPRIQASLEQAFQDAQLQQDARKQLHASLALLQGDASQIDYLYTRLLAAEPDQFAVIRDALFEYRDRVSGPLWEVALDRAQPPERRFRAAAALASYDPDNDAHWKTVNTEVAGHLVQENSLVLKHWMDALRPVKDTLFEPLAAFFRDGTADRTDRTKATEILANYAADQPELLVDLLLDADPDQFLILFPRLVHHRELIPSLLKAELRHVPSDEPDERDRQAKRQANAAIALFRMGLTEHVWRLLQHRPDPSARSWLIEQLIPMGADAKLLWQRLGEESDASARRALILCLGELDKQRASFVDRDQLASELLMIYREDSDPGMRAAAEWLLRRWGHDNQLERFDAELQVSEQQRSLAWREHGPRNWYVNTQGQTMVIVEADMLQMGSPSTDPDYQGDEQLRLVKIGRTFAISSKEVTVRQYNRFFREETSERPPHSPQTTVSWFQAAEYCNWLSEQEGISRDQWCYEPNEDGQFASGMRPHPGYLTRSGYRLPSDAEWEHACRSGTVTTRYYGWSKELLRSYAWYLDNSQHWASRVGMLKPNDFGLFDMLGNVVEWCHDREYRSGGGVEIWHDVPDTEPALESEPRVLRGGSFQDPPRFVRSAERYRQLPAGRRFYFTGFRVARTMPEPVGQE